MSLRKIDFVTSALEEIGYASYIYDIMPEQTESVLRALDSMLAAWYAKGIYLAYPLPDSPSYSDIEADTNVPDTANEAICKNLAISICSRFGKTPSQDLKQSAKSAYDALLIGVTSPKTRYLRTDLPVGSGNKPWIRANQSRYIQPPNSPINNGDDGEITFT